MMWLLGKLHRDGKLSRQRLVRVAIRCAETVAHLMPPEALPLLADVSAYNDGDTSIDIQDVCTKLWTIRTDAADADAAAACDAAYAAGDADAMCDVIRDQIDADEVATAMGINPDEVLS